MSSGAVAVPGDPLLVLSTKHNDIWELYRQEEVNTTAQTSHVCTCGNLLWRTQTSPNPTYACLSPRCETCIVASDEDKLARILKELRSLGK